MQHATSMGAIRANLLLTDQQPTTLFISSTGMVDKKLTVAEHSFSWNSPPVTMQSYMRA
jgi:hypothetical protein